MPYEAAAGTGLAVNAWLGDSKLQTSAVQPHDRAEDQSHLPDESIQIYVEWVFPKDFETHKSFVLE